MRVLLIATDDFFRDKRSFRHDFLPTRKSLVRNSDQGPIGWGSYLKIAFYILIRRYDFCLMPAVYYDWTLTDPFKIFLRRVLANKLVIGLVNFFLKKTKVVLLDMMDITRIAEDFARDYRACLYLKINLPLAASTASRLPMLTLPMWIFCSRNDSAPLLDFPERPIDVFYAGTPTNSAHRRPVPAILQGLRERGFRVVAPEQILTYHDFIARLCQSRIVMSPQGLGWHCFRHYECWACGAIPVINRPDERLATDLINGVNCIIYDSPEEAPEKIAAYLSGAKRLSCPSLDLPRLVEQKHTRSAVGRYLAQLLTPGADLKTEESRALHPLPEHGAPSRFSRDGALPVWIDAPLKRVWPPYKGKGRNFWLTLRAEAT